MDVFRKRRAGAPDGFFRCEAAGLRWLAAAGGTAVVDVLDVGDDHLDLRRLSTAPPTRVHAEAFGRSLAATHRAGAPAFGSPPDGWEGDGFFGPLDAPLPMPAGAHDGWGGFFAACRVEPLTRWLVDGGLVDATTRTGLDAIARRAAAGGFDDDEPPARLHGDLWSGNVVWTPDGAVLVDPAAHGGHRETDLAMLLLFGLPHLDDVLGAYEEEAPLRRGWRRRVPLHQLWPVGVHAVLFGGGYVGQLARVVAAAARG